MQQAGQHTGGPGPACVSDPDASNHVTADNVFADRPSPSRQPRGVIWLRLLPKTTTTEIKSPEDVFLKLTFSFLFNFSAFTHPLLHILRVLFLHHCEPPSLFCIKLQNSPSFFHHYKCLYQTALQDPPRLRPL